MKVRLPPFLTVLLAHRRSNLVTSECCKSHGSITGYSLLKAVTLARTRDCRLPYQVSMPSPTGVGVYTVPPCCLFGMCLPIPIVSMLILL